MQETPFAPAAMQGLLRYFHPSRAGRSQLGSAEKHLCAWGTALWTHIRNLVCKGKVGRRVCHGFPGWATSGQGPLDVLLHRSLSAASREGGPVITIPGRESEGGLLLKLLLCLPLKKTPSGKEALPFLRSRRNGVCPLPS